ncbi:4-alpha-glucanotransferase, partial [Prevotella conceptionensis]|uniref:4-alpha-glucanotransferase n=1 Tax=Prevotella conceptionensis TaxID=340486 RepID=UPI0005C4548F
MNLYFNIDYQTVFGEELVLNIVTNNDKGECLTTQYRMNTVDGLRWICCINKLPDACQNVVQYFYCVDSAGVTRRKEWALHPHRLSLSALKANAYHVYDQWHAIPEDAYQYTSAFAQCLKRRNLQPMPASDYERTLRLVVRAPQLRASQRLVLVGDDLALGAWALDRALPMAEVNDCEWVVDLNLDELKGEEIAVKFVAVDADNRVAPLWETGYNRELQLPQIGKNEVCVYQLHQAFFELWDERFAGTLVPVFSLRTKRSFGVGDFGDLKAMIDFVAQTNQRVLQVLPINDSTTTHTWTDSYPYSCISIFALHPQYVDLNALPLLKKEEDRMAFEALRQELNALSQIDYECVNNAKTAYLKLLFEQEGKEMMKGEDFKKFFEEESYWLVPYAQYCYLRDLYGTADFTQWPDHNTWDEAERKALSTPTTKAYKEVAFHYFVQYLLYTQMRHAHEHACAKGVILKGDIPIGVNRHGCDVWTEPHYFNLDGQAGAPPDDFSVKGQNWGFP